MRVCALSFPLTQMALSDPPRPMTSLVPSFLLFLAALSLQQMCAALLASSKLLTIVGGLTGSVVFLLCLTFVGNLQEHLGVRTGWGAVFLSLLVAATAAAFIHGVSFTTCILFSGGVLYEMMKVSAIVHQPELPSKPQAKGKKNK